MPTSSYRNCRRLSQVPVAFSAFAVAAFSIFLLGLATDFSFVPRIHIPSFERLKKKPIYRLPDFNKIVQYNTLSSEELGLDDPTRRLLIVGDVHGMNKSLHNLLSATSYDPEKDTLLFAGDVMAKSTLAGSLAVLDFITEHRCNPSTPGRIYSVRGNHDQMIVQWSAWRDWYEPLQLTPPPKRTPDGNVHPDAPVRTGRAFLDLIEAEWEHDRKHDPKSAADPLEWADTERKRAVGSWRAQWWMRIPQPGEGHTAKDWAIFDDHYWLAKELTAEQKECLYSWPLVLHVPSEHFFVAHAGILPFDPQRPYSDARQPLAHPPALLPPSLAQDESIDIYDGADDSIFIDIPGRAQETFPPTSLVAQKRASNDNETYELLRNIQEVSVLTDIEGNNDPWVLLNMRGIRQKKGKVTRRNDKGTPWSKVWNSQIKRCAGFGSVHPVKAHAEDEDADNDDADTDALPCEPITVVYGHAATRGLDIKRWSMGIDTGCLYGRRLTSLVLQHGEGAWRRGDDDDDEEVDDEDGEDIDEDEEDDDDEALLSPNDGHASHTEEPDLPPKARKTRIKQVRFGDDDAGINAHLVSIRCPDLGDLE